MTNLATSVAGITAPVRLGNLIQASPNDGSLAGASLNALDLVNGTAQLFNFANVATTPTPITVSGASLGLPGVVTSAHDLGAGGRAADPDDRPRRDAVPLVGGPPPDRPEPGRQPDTTA